MTSERGVDDIKFPCVLTRRRIGDADVIVAGVSTDNLFSIKGGVYCGCVADGRRGASSLMCGTLD